MHWPSGVIGIGGLAFASAVIGLAAAPQSTAPAKAVAAASAGEAGYVGSAACERCHESQYGTWSKTLHVQMTKPIAQARVVGSFAPGTHFEQYGRAYTMETHDGRYFISISKGGRPPERFEVNYTLGARRFQGYLSRLTDGRIYVLPVFWHNESKRWVDWKEITPIPDDPDHDLRQIWNVTCVNCHATNLVKNFTVASNSYATTWTEMGIGCEACHGPGAAHIALTDEWLKNPSSKPAYSNSDGNRALSQILKIFSPRTAPPRQVFDSCGYCHGNKNNVFFGFKPGDRYEDYALPFLISQPIPDNDPQGDFWPDGRPSRFNRPQALTLTGCFRKGNVSCTSCHRMHASNNDHALKVPVTTATGARTRQSDLLCTQCHRLGPARNRPAVDEPAAVDADTTTGYGAALTPAARIPDLTAHTHHAPDSQGSRCVECHMSDVNWRLFTRRRDHTFQPPVPEITAKYGAPNACTTCHEDKSPEWAARTMDAWYGNRERREAVVRVADAMYHAGAGEASALVDVARLASDRNHGATIRASAAEFAGQLIAKGASGPSGAVGAAGASRASAASGAPSAVVNALIGAANDPEPLVRATAVRSLGGVVDDRTTAVIAARLADPARVVRVRAAAALMDRGISRLDGAVGAALARAQGEWADSLRTFNDEARDQTTLGWLELSRGHELEAATALNAAITLDPTAAQPHVYLGVAAARAGRFDDALKQFTAAKSLQPTYPNIDRLIEEAEKRR